MKKDQKPLLADGLNPGERTALAAIMQMPGWSILEKLHFAAVTEAKDDVLRVDPEEAGAKEKISVRQLRARERSEFSLLILMSAEWHAKALSAVSQPPEEKQQNPIFQMPKAKD